MKKILIELQDARNNFVMRKKLFNLNVSIQVTPPINLAAKYTSSTATPKLFA